MDYVEYLAINKLNNLYAKLKACEFGFIDKYSEYDNISEEIRDVMSYLHKKSNYIKNHVYYRIMRQLRRIDKLKSKLYYKEKDDILIVVKYKEMMKEFEKL